MHFLSKKACHQIKLLTQHRHFEAQEFIKSQLREAKSQGQQAILLTHHEPPRQSSMMALFKDYKDHFPLWLYGHTHFSTSSEQKGTLVLSNQLGYPQLGSIDRSFRPEVSRLCHIFLEKLALANVFRWLLKCQRKEQKLKLWVTNIKRRKN